MRSCLFTGCKPAKPRRWCYSGGSSLSYGRCEFLNCFPRSDATKRVQIPLAAWCEQMLQISSTQPLNLELIGITEQSKSFSRVMGSNVMLSHYFAKRRQIRSWELVYAWPTWKLHCSAFNLV